MIPLLDNILDVMASRRGGRPECLMCGRPVSSADERLLLRGGSVAHRGCATYDTRRRRRQGAERLGYPPR